jgi:NADH dehydrogenase
MEPRAKVGILGGGFGGLYAVFYMKKYLARDIEVTLFDKNNYLLYTPVLHEMATGTVNARHVVVPVRKVIQPRQVRIRCEEVIQVDLARKSLETLSGTFSFDFLILSPGSETNFYCFPNLRENSMTFKTIGDAALLRNRLIDALERGALEKDTDKKRKLLTITVAGGGCTGVEVVAEIAQFIKVILHRDYPEIKRDEVRIYLIEAMDRILPSFPKYLSQVATQRLRRMGIEVRLSCPIQAVDRDSIRLKDGQIPKGILVWAAGVKARDLPLVPDVKRDKNGRFMVTHDLEIPGYPGVYVIGDAALFVEDKNPLPPTASVAVQEARFVAQSLRLRVEKKEVSRFQFHYRGDMASLGFMFGVCEIHGWHFKGWMAWLLWKAFKLAMLPRYKNRFQIVADWLITLVFKRDTSKLM